MRVPSRFWGAVLAAAFLASVEGQAEAQGNVKAGQEQASQRCAVCHGLDGLAKVAEAPNLAGQNEQYLVEQLGAFKAGVRTNEMMSIIVKDLSPADIADLAAYYAAIEISVVKVPGN